MIATKIILPAEDEEIYDTIQRRINDIAIYWALGKNYLFFENSRKTYFQKKFMHIMYYMVKSNNGVFVTNKM